MRIALFLLAICVPLFACGCFTRDTEHDIHHWHTMENDLELTHHDLDNLLE